MSVLDEVLVRLQRMEVALAERDQQLAERDAQLAAAHERIAILEARVAELEDLLKRSSLNSGQPPSSDTPAQRLERRERAKARGKGSDKKRGAQPGHKGHKRQVYSPEEVSAVIDCAPTNCRECGEQLDASRNVEVLSEQVVELPPIQPVVTEYRLHRCECAACGVMTTGQRPAGAPPGGFGPRLTALAAMLSGAYHLSRRKTVALLRDSFGIRMSIGALSTCERRVSEALADAYEGARTHVQEAE